MKPSFFKGIVLGAATAGVTLCAATAVAGTGIGGIFNLGQDNTVDGQTLLRGNTGGNPQLRVNNQQGTDAATGVLGIHSAGAGAAPGVQGESASTSANATGVFGRMTSANAAVGSAAVRGVNNGNGFGVYGRSQNVPFGYAVFGEGRYGVVGSGLFSGASSGVYGNAPSGFAGVEGHTANSNGFGAYGQNSGSGSGVSGAGIYGVHSSTFGTGAGVIGETNSSSGNATGILARSNATNPGRDAVAVRAINASTNQYGMGVWGSVNGAGWGVLGEAGANGIGTIGKVPGAGTAVYGLAGPSGVGVRGIGGKTGVYGQATDSGGYAFAANGDAGQNRSSGGFVKAMAVVDWHQPAGQQVTHCFNSQVAPGTPYCGITANGLAVGDWQLDFGFDVSDRFVLVTPWFAARSGQHGVVANAYPIGGSKVEVGMAYNGGEDTNSIFTIAVF